MFKRSLKLECCDYFSSAPQPTLLLSSAAIAVILSPKSNSYIDSRVDRGGGFAPPPTPIRTSPDVISRMTSSRGQVAWVE
ncbi:hypothetical protein TNCV_1089551 [Trichonephila clavipes]|uniref:Uncharacterized protein n=1 Tax=Trichonephila clavipes TaxID=2585209 RepID=A0A8X6VL80_TRICX|nr:hypothetical protein TNCV_1089551 [Trichonephila clavipes]